MHDILGITFLEMNNLLLKRSRFQIAMQIPKQLQKDEQRLDKTSFLDFALSIKTIKFQAE